MALQRSAACEITPTRSEESLNHRSNMTQPILDIAYKKQRKCPASKPRVFYPGLVAEIVKLKTDNPTLRGWEIHQHLSKNNTDQSRVLPSVSSINRVLRKSFLSLAPQDWTVVRACRPRPKVVTPPTTIASASQCSEGSSDSWYLSFTWDSPQPPTSQVDLPSPTQTRCENPSDDTLTFPSVPRDRTETDGESSSKYGAVSKEITSKKSRNPSIYYTPDQRAILEKEFQQSHYPDIYRRREMGGRLGLTEKLVHMWFINRRTKWRRKEKMFHQNPLPPTCAYSTETSSNDRNGDLLIAPAESPPPPEPIALNWSQDYSSYGHPDDVLCARAFRFDYPLPLAEHCEYMSQPRSVESRPTSSARKVSNAITQCMYY